MEGKAAQDVGDRTQPRTVLVVDDDPDCREVVAEFLGLRGYHVDLAANGQEALSRLRDPNNLRPNLILLDLMMPILDGWGFRNEQIHDPSLAQIPVVMITGAGEDISNEYGSLQTDDFMKKPVDYDRLSVIVDRYCH